MTLQTAKMPIEESFHLRIFDRIIIANEHPENMYNKFYLFRIFADVRTNDIEE